jgi:hypothetical protein
MSREAVINVAFVAKAPANPSQWNRIFDLATRLMQARESPPDSSVNPDNIIDFPVCGSERDGLRKRG